MASVEQAKSFALSLPEVKELPHFDKPSFRVSGKIFATINLKENRVCVKLSEIDQSVFCAFDKSQIYAVPNKWGKQGWTLAQLKNIPTELLEDLLTSSYCLVAPKKYAALVRKDP